MRCGDASNGKAKCQGRGLVREDSCVDAGRLCQRAAERVSILASVLRDRTLAGAAVGRADNARLSGASVQSPTSDDSIHRARSATS